MSFLILIIISLFFMYSLYKILEKDILRESKRLKNSGISHKVIKKWYGLYIVREQEK